MLRPPLLRKLVPATIFGALLAVALVASGSPPRALAANAVTVDSASNAGWTTSLALDGSGNPVVAYYDSSPNFDVKVVHCGNTTCTAGNTFATPDTGLISQGVSSMVLDGTGRPVASYRENSGDGDLKLLHCGNTTCTAGNTITTPDAGVSVGSPSSIVLDTLGNPVVSYYDSSNGDLKVLHCNDANCAAGGDSITLPDSTGTVGDYSSLALDGSGNPVVSYYDYTNQDLKLLHCNDANCAPGGDSVTSPDTAGSVGSYTSLVLDASGMPVVSYFECDATDSGFCIEGHLKVLRCGNANCTVVAATVDADTGQLAGYDSSIELDASGNPVMSYYYCGALTGFPPSCTVGDLRILHCGNANCTAGNVITAPDTTGNVGERTSLKLDGSGNPVVSYVDDTNDDLKVLHCTDPYCGGKMVAQNDAFANATVVGPPYVEAINTTGATNAGNDPLESCSFGGAGYSNSVWYQYTPPLTRKVRISTAGSDYDTVLVVYSGTKGALTEVGCNDDANATVQSEADVQLSAGTTYYILVGDWSSPGGGLLHFSLGPEPFDADGDGCDDFSEQQTGPGTQLSGGNRNYLNPYDYFNPSHDLQNRIDDILLVVQAYFKDDNDGNPGQLPYAGNYNADYDRTDDPGSGDAWRLLGPNGLQRVDDILNAVKQYFHDCA